MTPWRCLTTAVNIALPRPHAAQYRVLAGVRRFSVVCCGRRWGKTTLGIDRIVGPATLERGPVGWFSPTYKMLSDTWREVRRTLIPVTERKDETEHRLEL